MLLVQYISIAVNQQEASMLRRSEIGTQKWVPDSIPMYFLRNRCCSGNGWNIKPNFILLYYLEIISSIVVEVIYLHK